MAERVGASALACPTLSGATACIMATFRPPYPILAITPLESTIRKMCFSWGVTGILTEVQDGLAPICYDALKVARRSGVVNSGDLVVITAGDPVTSPLEGNASRCSTNVCMIAEVF